MKITKLDIPKSIDSQDGLEHIKMDRLCDVVLIAGKNGSGKTRTLNKIVNSLQYKSTRDNNIGRLLQLEAHVGSLKAAIDSQKHLNPLPNHLPNLDRQLRQAEQEINQLKPSLNSGEITTSETANNYSVVRFVPKHLDLSDASTFSKVQIKQYASQMNAVGMDNLTQGTLAKIQLIQDRWFNVTHQGVIASEEEKTNAINDYEKLKTIIHAFLGTTIGRTSDGETTLFGFQMGQANLSDGQKILLKFCIAIYSQQTALKDLILVMDEPENPLHPSVIIETIERIRECVTNGQIWIATHSIPLLAHFDPLFIWYVENNKITHAGKTPEKVLQSLLGDENEIARLQDFISLPAQYATNSFAAECLLEPTVIITGSTDPQSRQIREALENLKINGKLRVLDYGAGKGRIIANICDFDEGEQYKLIESIDYIAFDKFPDDKEHCEAAVTKAYGSCEKRYFNDLHKLLTAYDKSSFDVVIMCNVLHEIDPKDWLILFRSDGQISSLLSDSGFLLLVEDQQIPVGEKAYQKGFLVLDTPQLKDLFKISEADSDFIMKDARDDGRLKSHLIPKRCLVQIDDASRKAALKSLSGLAKDRILEIRSKEKNYQNGKLHGFWTQQFANAQLNIDEFQ